jgi:protein ImuB
VTSLDPCFACVHCPPGPLDDAQPAATLTVLVKIAQDFSPRFECHRDDLISIDISGLRRLFGGPHAIGEELRRSAASQGLRVHVAIAATRTAAMVLAIARPGLTIVEPGAEAAALAPLAVGVLEKSQISSVKPQGAETSDLRLDTFKRWGIRTLGDLAALPSTDLATRLGQQGLIWQNLARGQDGRPLVPTLPEERFESSVELEWPIEGLEPLSFVLTRLLEPLSTRLERRDRGAAALHVTLGLVKSGGSSESYPTWTRSLELPSPMRDVRALRTLILLDLESHPPPAAVDRVSVRIEPTPGRVLQHTLFTRAQPTPEQLSTLVARLNALMGQDRIGRPLLLDSYRPGAFGMQPFATEHHSSPRPPAPSLQPQVISALRRCRHPVPARVAVADDRPVAVSTDRRGFAGGRVLSCAGPWRTSGEWWAGKAGRAGEAGKSGRAGGENASSQRHPIGPTHQAHQTHPPHLPCWNRDEWDVSLGDGAVYRIFRDCETDAWFIDAIID